MKRIFYTNLVGRTILFLCFLFLYQGSNSFMHAQVTIGSGIPPLKGNLLDLKESSETNGEANATKGLGLPRVELTSLTTLSIDDDSLKTQYTGTFLYNTKSSSTITKGLYYWNGNNWVSLSGTSKQPWYKVGTNSQSELNTDDSYLKAKAIIGGDSYSYTTGTTPAQLSIYGATVLNGSATEEPLYIKNIKKTSETSATEAHMPLVISEAGVVRKAHINDEVISSPNYAMGTGDWLTLYDKSTWVPGTLNELKDIGTLQHVGNNTRGNYIVLPETGIYMLHLRAYFKIEYVQRTENPYAVVLPFTYNVIDSNGTLFDYVHSTIVAPNSGGSNITGVTEITGQNTHLYVSGKKGDKFKIQIRFDAGINLTTGALNNISKVLFNTIGNKGYLAVSISKLSEIVLDN